MAEIKSFEGNKTNKPKCPYCGIVDSSEHPDFTCPRLSSASWGGEGTAVEFIDPDKWEVIKSRL